MSIHGQWPNVERLLIAHLREATDVTVLTEPPDDLEQAAPVIFVERIPGGYGRDYDKTFVVDITVFTTSRGALWDLVQQVETAMASCVLFDTIAEQSAFGHVAYANPALRRAVGTYTVTARPQ